MALLDDQLIDVECPSCHFHTSVTFRECRLDAAVICRGCKSVLMLRDQRHSLRKAQRKLEGAVAQLGGSINITLRL